ncbi:hypothetical protein TKK_0010465 [Trichogramma kaykai]
MNQNLEIRSKNNLSIHQLLNDFIWSTSAKTSKINDFELFTQWYEEDVTDVLSLYARINLPSFKDFLELVFGDKTIQEAILDDRQNSLEIFRNLQFLSTAVFNKQNGILDKLVKKKFEQNELPKQTISSVDERVQKRLTQDLEHY